MDVGAPFTGEAPAGVNHVELDAVWTSTDAALDSRRLTDKPPHEDRRICNTPNR
jgi:hypothetical protein